jgi:hypothetical protein
LALKEKNMIYKTAVCIVLGCAAWAQSVNEAGGARPLFAAIERIQVTYGIAINYEDPPFQFEGDSVDVTEKVQTPDQRAASPNVRIRVPRGGELTWNPPSIRPGNIADALPVVAQIIAASESKGYPGRFRVLEVPGGLSVAPTAIRNEYGEWIQVTPVMATNVSFEARDRTMGELIDEVLRQVSQRRGVKIGLAGGPIGLLVHTRTSAGAQERSASEVLADLFQEVTRQTLPSAAPGVSSLLTYRVMFDPGLRYYLLTLTPAGGGAEQGRVPEAAPPATSSGGVFGGVRVPPTEKKP